MNSTTVDPGMDSTVSTPAPGHTLPITPVAMLFLFGALGNIIAMVVLVYTSKTHKWKSFHRLVGALAISDFIGICGPLPISLAAYSNNKKWSGGQPVCDLMSFFFIFTGLTSAYTAGAMSLDRFIAVRLPHFYNAYATRLRVNITIVVLWITSFIVACLPLVGVNENVRQFPGTWCFFNFMATKSKDIFFSFLYASLGIIVIVMMLVCNTYVIIVLCRRRIHANNEQNTNRSSLNDIYNVVFLVVLMTVFSICWVPLMVRIFINQVNKFQTDPSADLLVMRLAIVNQIMDPWIYILLRKDFLVMVFNFIRKYMPGFCQCTEETSTQNERLGSISETSGTVNTYNIYQGEPRERI